MRARALFTGSAILLASAIAAGQSPTLNSPASSSSSPQAQHSGAVLQVKTRVITVDVVATDLHGNVVRDLKPEEFDVSDDGRQKIAHFAFIDKSANSATAKLASAAQPRPKGFYTNQAEIGSLTMPPTVVLLDGLNSDVGDLMETRRHMLRLLETIPRGAPVAVFLLVQSLVVVQDFSSDPAVLRAAVDKAMRSATPIDRMPENDPNTPNVVLGNENGEHEDILDGIIEDFEKRTFANIMDIRVRTTLDALRTIARYLRGYPGRKNLIWVSASFPITFLPDPNFGTQASLFDNVHEYGEQLREAAKALADAHVAVYPANARGLETSQAFAPDQSSVLSRNASPSVSSQLNSEDSERMMSQGAMDQLAQDTGGKACKNTNDLSGCVETALKDSSSYYELAYYPQNTDWNGSFHTIFVRTTRHGVSLKYRRGYFALDEGALAKQQPPEMLLEQTCKDLLPSTAIPITAQAIPSEKPDDIRYLMSVPPGALSLAPDGQSHKLSAQMATCVYSASDSSFRFTTRDLSRTLSDADFNSLQTGGLHGYLDAPKAGTERVRIAVLDLATGLTGALDIAVHPEDLENAAASPAGLVPAPALSAPAPENPPLLPVYSLSFQSSSGAAGALDWKDDRLFYQGAVGPDQAAPPYFHDTLGAKFHCEDGDLIPRDSSEAKPDLHFSFKNPTGQTAVVDLTGSEPQYSGDLPVDPSAKPFFETLWYLCHCRAAQP